MDIFKQIRYEQNKLIQTLEKLQDEDGAWRFCFEGSSMTDAYMIILLRSLKIDDEETLIKTLVERILSRQDRTGAWKQYYDEKSGDLSSTVENYFALLYSGYVSESDENMILAKYFILRNGGIYKVEWLTKAMLALTGQIPWPTIIKLIPIEMMLLPPWSPINMYSIVGYARAHWVPIIISSNKNFSIQNEFTPNLSHLISERATDDERLIAETKVIFEKVKEEAKKFVQLPHLMRSESFKRSEKYMLDRIEGNGTLFSYYSSSFFMIYSLLALGYSRNHPVIVDAIKGIKTFLCKIDEQFHIQNSPSTVWDTALITNSLQKAGLSRKHSIINKSVHYLVSRQQTRYGDWVAKNRDAVPGGWGFSHINTLIPDIDDTTAALRSISPFVGYEEKSTLSWEKGVEWLLSMQNQDGGWPAFEKNTENKWFSFVPFRYEDRVLFDPSTADLTGRTLHFLGEFTNLPSYNKQIRRGIKWLKNNQEENGSWYGRWGICYIYGTWAALTGLKACDVSSTDPIIQKAANWLLSIQNSDGGWGESCSSDMKLKYVPLYASTPSQTAWALDALIAVHEKPTPEIQKGIRFLMTSLYKNNWTVEYPTGAGLPGGFYVRYHSYNYIWPLLTLSNYLDKYEP
ncbi:squalene--hopene cyclase [Bacillus sp. 31A1R]|uniref:Squalene--hopene cyclase n=1 Tax=Robertmurraya mangrovi TaxID=3098077 RepID=A0ABU5J3D8_9BACI|nr:squalene--hopene cyclase [Bacillus sp. 31A1R]MDZ5473922.1 squalene--hopene cyclase [Bacillus sp. 31A1R]